MPKSHKKKLRKIKRRRKNNNLGVFILVGFLACFIIFVIIREPINEQVGKKTDTVDQKQDMPSRSKKRNKKEGKILTHDKKSTSVSDRKALGTNQIREEKNTPEVAIVNTIGKLGIPKSYYRKRNTEEYTIYNVPIDKSIMDLVYANMIFKGELESNGAKFIKGTDNPGKQTLLFNFSNVPKQYQINIYYDSELYKNKQTRRTITLVVDDFGPVGGDLLEGFLALDKEICFAILPDETYSVLTMEKAKEQGRTTIIHIPMEPIGYPEVNPGKNAILVQYEDRQIDKVLSHFIEQLPYCEGVNNHMGSLATTDEEVMSAVMATLKKHNKFFLDSRATNISIAYAIAQKYHIKSYRNDLFLDSPNISQSTMDAKLNQIIELSNNNKNVIAISHCHNFEKLQYLKRIINRLKAAGFTLVPITEIDKYNVPEIL